MPQATDRREVCFDDVVHAYRWILGREPETVEILETQAPAGRDVQSLRSVLLGSPEFRIKFLNSEIDNFWSPETPDILPPTTDRLVFIHIPRTGGTSLHNILSEAVGANKVCAARHNSLRLCLAGDLASARLFSGHYDCNSVALIPGRTLKAATMLRDPRRRLLSLYDFLRAHRPSVIKANNLALADAARRYSLGDFLDAAMEINPAAVDNTYLRTFGGRLPFRRWEQAAESESPKTLADFGCSVEELRGRAAHFLHTIEVVGILEQFEASVSAISHAFKIDPPQSFSPLQSLKEITGTHDNIEPIQPYLTTPSDEARIVTFTQYDNDLYKLGVYCLAQTMKSQSAQLPCIGGDFERSNPDRVGLTEKAAAAGNSVSLSAKYRNSTPQSGSI